MIALTECQLADPDGLVAFLSRELARGLLVGRGLLQDDPDADWLTDLLPVYLGFGVFAVNAALRQREAGSHGRHGHCTGRRNGGLSSCMIAYALALFAWAREQRSPEWGKFLHPGAADMLAAGLRYLHATEDSLFGPETCCSADRPISWNALLEQIAGSSPSACVAGLWELAQRSMTAARMAGRPWTWWASSCPTACRPCGRKPLVPWPPWVGLRSRVGDLIQLLEDENQDVCMAAAYALGRLGMQPDKVLPNLVLALDDRNLVRPAAAAIATYGCAARHTVPTLRAALLKALAETE